MIQHPKLYQTGDFSEEFAKGRSYNEEIKEALEGQVHPSWLEKLNEMDIRMVSSDNYIIQDKVTGAYGQFGTDLSPRDLLASAWNFLKENSQKNPELFNK